MRIETTYNSRKLIKDSNYNKRDNEDDNKGNEVNISNGEIIKYTGIYYKIINDIDYYAKVETAFIGKIECEKSTPHDGLTGIYVKPLYIWDKLNSKWKKIKEYKFPTNVYFLYPHLLQLPNRESSKYPLYFLHTCENTNLDEYLHVTEEFKLDEII